MFETCKNDYELNRLKALLEYHILNSTPEIEYDGITKVASTIYH